MKQRIICKCLAVAVIVLFLGLAIQPSVAVYFNVSNSEGQKIDERIFKSIKSLTFGANIYINGDDEFTPKNGVRGGNETKENPYITENFYILGMGEYATRIMNTRAHSIYINGDDEFTPQNGVSAGNGTKENPYIIENFYILNMGEYAIRIMNTRAHFIVRNCITVKCGIGIDLLNVENGTLENCTTSNNLFKGISAEKCNYINVINCTSQWNEATGISIKGNYCYLSGCICSDNNYFEKHYGVGIYIVGSNNTVFNSTCARHYSYDFYIKNGANNIINGFTCYNYANQGGFELFNLHQSSVKFSEFWVIANFRDSSEIEIEYNEFKETANFIGSSEIEIEYNQVKNLYISSSQDVLVNINDINTLTLRLTKNIKVKNNNIWSDKLTFAMFCRNIKFNENYWERWKGFGVKIIFGFIRIFIDWNPATEPYDI